jgi:hypothetical protein
MKSARQPPGRGARGSAADAPSDVLPISEIVYEKDLPALH